MPTPTIKIVDGCIILPHITTPTAPDANFDKLYVKSDDKLYRQTSGGTENEVGGGGGGGATTTVDISVTLGETITARQLIYRKASDNKWYLVDIDASPIAIGKDLAFAVSGGNNNDTVTARRVGALGGYSGLTAGERVYASSTAGGVTQIRPTVSLGGSQVAIVDCGYARTTTEIIIQFPEKISYLKRVSLANNATTSIVHHADTAARLRVVRAYESGTATGQSLTSYASANQDVDVALRQLAYGTDVCTGGTATASTSDALYPASRAFDNNTADYGWIATTNTGTLQYQLSASKIARRYTLFCFANAVQPPRMPTAWTFQGSNDGSNWTTLDTQSGVTSWSQGETKTYSFSNSTPYTYYRMNISANNGDALVSIDEMQIMEASGVKDKLAQSFQISSTTEVDQLTLWLKKVGSPTGTLTARIETNSSGQPSGTLVNANATITIAESGLGTSYANAVGDWATNFSPSGATTYWVVLSTDRAASETDYVCWGADASSPSYASGEMKSESASVWGAENKDAVFDILAPGYSFDGGFVMGRWSSGTRDIGFLFGNTDTPPINADTTTTFKNVTGLTLSDVTVVTEV